MNDKRGTERMKLYSFSNSDIFGELVREGCSDEYRRKLQDKPEFTVIDDRSGDHIGNLVDISTSGVMIVSEFAVTENTKYRLKMEFLRDIRFDAVCAWSRDIGAGNFISGFEFTDIDPNDLSAIEDAIDRFTAGE